MRNKLYVIGLVCLALILSACGANGTPPSGSGGGSEGTLPNGSNVAISTSSIILDASESTAAGTLSISGGSANATYTFVFADSVVNPASLTSKARTNSTDSNGISVVTTPSPCTLGTVGTGLPTSCSFNVSASPSTPAGKYTIAITAQGSDGSATILNPLTVIVNGSTLSDAKAITSFAINNVDARIIGQNITLTLPFGTNPTALIATYVTTGESVSVNSVLQDDGVTPNDFTNPVEYVVHAADGTTATYTVTVAIAPPAPTITITTPGFSSGSSIIQGSAFTVVATLSGSNVTAQTISVSNSAALSNAGISVTSSPSPCTLSTPSNMTCTFTIYADWSLATAGNYTLQLSNSGSITLDQTSIAFSVYSPAVYLPQTGISTTQGGTSVPTGLDGNPAIGLNWPNSRFAMGAGTESKCTTDSLTGLMWVSNIKESSINSITGTGMVFTTTTTGDTVLAAITGVNALNSGVGYCGHNDWRLPNINELRSLVNYGVWNNGASSGPAYYLNNSGFFANVQAGLYWSSSLVAQNPTDYAWYVYFTDGDTNPGGYQANSLMYVWPVRGTPMEGSNPESVAVVPQTGESATIGATLVPSGLDGNPAKGTAWPTTRFKFGTGAESKCTTDTLTGLMWVSNIKESSINSITGTGMVFTTTTTGDTVLAAIANVNALNSGVGYCGHNDWRLPNIDELVSLVNYGSTAGPAAYLNSTSFFTNVQAGYYWSSSLRVQNPTLGAWYVSFAYGYADPGGRQANDIMFVWPVRSGQ